MIGFRRHGHNEVDNPRFTQPEMYKAVDAEPSIADSYAERLKKEGVLNGDHLEQFRKEYVGTLDKALKRVDGGETKPT